MTREEVADALLVARAGEGVQIHRQVNEDGATRAAATLFYEGHGAPVLFFSNGGHHEPVLDCAQG